MPAVQMNANVLEKLCFSSRTPCSVLPSVCIYMASPYSYDVNAVLKIQMYFRRNLCCTTFHKTRIFYLHYYPKIIAIIHNTFIHVLADGVGNAVIFFYTQITPFFVR